MNPLQAKHIPVSPHTALDMMRALGEKVAARYPAAKLVIGFAETATAIGAVVAETLGADCAYITTTREHYADGEWTEFAEEHSHAAEQFIDAAAVNKHLANTDTVVFVDDEFSTGRTLLNIVNNLRRNSTHWQAQKIVAASILYRLSPDNEQQWHDNGIAGESLLKISPATYTPPSNLQAPLLRGAGAKSLPGSRGGSPCGVCGNAPIKKKLPNPRRGTTSGEYRSACASLAAHIGNKIKSNGELAELQKARRLLVLGSEECMYPALVVGQYLEQILPQTQIFCHATTRSPIGVSDAPGYPIYNGYVLPSLYDAERTTYIYNVAAYDAAIIVTDAPNVIEESRQALADVLTAEGTPQIVFL